MITGYRKTIVTLPNGKKMPLVDMLGPLPDAVKGLCDELRPWLDGPNENYARSHFQVGGILKARIAQVKAELEQSGYTTYGAHLFEGIGAELDVEPSTLRGCLQVAESFTLEQYESQIIAPGLTWSHARLLAGVAYPQQRELLIARTIADRLSVRELGELIRGNEPKKPRGPGRVPAPPLGLPQGLHRLWSGSKTYLNTLSVLFGAEFDLSEEIQVSPPDKLTAETRAIVVECGERLTAIQQAVEDARARLTAGLERIDTCIAAQAEQEKTAHAEENEGQERRRVRRAPAHVG